MALFHRKDEKLTLKSASGQEVVPDVEATERQRLDGEPAFLKHMLVQDFLPALITILHSIPKLRNALMSSDSFLHDYGFNPQWWSGESTETPSILYVDDSMVTENTTSPSCPPIVAEVQRLMAFLSKTERAYGSAEPLSRVHAIKLYEQTSSIPKPLMERFVETWDSVGDAESLFLSTVTDAKQTSGATKDIHMFEAMTGFPSPDSEMTLIDVLDSCFWDKQENGDFEADHFLDDVAPVQILTIRPHRNWKLIVPPTLYLDRYLLSNRSIIESMKKQNSSFVERVTQADTKLKKLRTFKYNPSTGMSLGPEKEGDAVKLMEDSIKYLKERIEGKENDDENSESVRTLRKLEEIFARVDGKVRELEEEKLKAKDTMKKFSTILTDPDTSPHPPDFEFSRRYVLRGVATAALRHLTTYALHPSSLTPFARSGSLQWWKMSYDTSGHTPRIEKAIVTEEEVLKKASEGTEDTMLVYTSEDMLSGPPPIPLAPQLERFVSKDNAAFRDELSRAAPTGGPGPAIGPAVPITITGVRTRSGSRGSDDSMTVNRDDEAMEMEEHDRPPPYNGSEAEFEDVKMDLQPEMQEVGGQGRPGLFAMPRGRQVSSDTEMEGP